MSLAQVRTHGFDRIRREREWVSCGHTCVTPQTRSCTRASMICPDLASYYRNKYDSGPDSFMARWRSKYTLKQMNSGCARCKPNGIPLRAWIYLAGPYSPGQHHVGADMKPKSKGTVQAIAPALGPRVPVGRHPGGHHYTKKIINDIRADCLKLLIHNGYEEAQAQDLVKRCGNLTATRYDNRPQVVRRLTLPDEPTNRVTSLTKWVQQIQMNHPPSNSTDGL